MRVLDTHNERKAAFGSLEITNRIFSIYPNFQLINNAKTYSGIPTYAVYIYIYILDEKRFSGRLFIVNLSKSRLLLKDH